MNNICLWFHDGPSKGKPLRNILNNLYNPPCFSVDQAELMSGFIELCVELKSVSEGGAACETDGEVSVSQQPAGQDGSNKNGRGGRRGMLQRQSSVLCSRVHSLNTISYVDNGESNGVQA